MRELKPPLLSLLFLLLLLPPMSASEPLDGNVTCPTTGDLVGAPGPMATAASCNATLATGFCTAPAASSVENVAAQCGGCGAAALMCSSTRVRGELAPRTTFVCSGEAEGERLQCPDSHPAVIATCGSLAAACAQAGNAAALIPCRFFGLLCAQSSSPAAADQVPIAPFTCEWRAARPPDEAAAAAGAGGWMRCETAIAGEAEVLGGLCLGSRQEHCGGTPFGSAFRCCLFRPRSSCVARGAWNFINDGGTCPRQTAVQGACSVRCDADALFGAHNPTNPGMFACDGRIYTRRTSRWVSACARFPRCPPQSLMLRFEQCTDPQIGAGVRVHCENVSYAAVAPDAQCFDVGSDDIAFCPGQHHAVGLCAPFAVRACPGGVDTVVRCCRVRSYANMGATCTPSLVHTLAGGLHSAMTRPDEAYGVDANASLALTSVGEVVGVHGCGGVVYATDRTGHAVLRVDSPANRLTVAMGRYGVAGYERSGWNPEEWTRRATALNHTYSITSHQHCNDFLFVDWGNLVARLALQRPGTTTPFVAYIVAGLASTTPTLFQPNNSLAFRSRLNTLSGIIYRPTHRQIFISTVGAVLRVDEPTSNLMYFIGDGVTTGPLLPSAARTQGRVAFPRQFAMFHEALMYASDHDTASAGGGVVHVVDFDRDHMNFQPGLIPGTIPLGLAIYNSRILYYTSSNSHCIYAHNLQLNIASFFAGSCTFPGFTDHVAPGAAQFRNPHFLAVDDSLEALLIADRGNRRIRRISMATRECDTGFSPWFDCARCDAGYSGYPRCRLGCTIEDDCNGQASAVSGAIGSCACVCKEGWAGPSCGICQRGRDIATGCTQCLLGHSNFPSCTTDTATLTLSLPLTPSAELTLTATITPPPTPSYTATSTASLPLTPTATLDRSRTRPPTATLELTATATLQATETESLSATATRQLTESPTLTGEVTASESASISGSASLSADPTATALTESLSATATVSDDSTASPSRSLVLTKTITITPPPTRTQTGSWALLRPIVSFWEREIDRHNINDVNPHRRTVTIAVLGQFETSVALNTAMVRCTKEVWFDKLPFDDPRRAQELGRGGSESGGREVPFGVAPDDRIAVLTAHEARHLRAAFVNAVPRSLNLTHLSIALARPSEEFFNIRDVFVHLALSAECFVNRREPRTPAVLRIARLPPPRLVAETVANAALGLGGASAALSALTTGHALGAAVFPALITLELAECRALPQAHLSVVVHPFHFPLGDGPHSTYLAAAIMNTLLVSLLLLLHWAAAHYSAETAAAAAASQVVDQPRRGPLGILFPREVLTALRRSMARWRFPSYTLVLVKLLGAQSISVSLALIIGTAKHHAVAYPVLLLWVASVCAAVALGTKYIRAGTFGASWEPLTIVDLPPRPHTPQQRLFGNYGRWVNTQEPDENGGTDFRRQFGPWFAYCQGRGLFYAVQFEPLLLCIAGLLHGVMHGIGPTKALSPNVSCLVFASLHAVLLLASAAVLVASRPFTHSWNNVVGGLVAALQVAAGVAAVAGAAMMQREDAMDDPSRATRRIASALAVAALFASILFCAVPALKVRKWLLAPDAIERSRAEKRTGHQPRQRRPQHHHVHRSFFVDDHEEGSEMAASQLKLPWLLQGDGGDVPEVRDEREVEPPGSVVNPMLREQPLLWEEKERTLHRFWEGRCDNDDNDDDDQCLLMTATSTAPSRQEHAVAPPMRSRGAAVGNAPVLAAPAAIASFIRSVGGAPLPPSAPPPPPDPFPLPRTVSEEMEDVL